ncbi:MAG: tRNA lysidine(34) synthetase TilS [Bacteroidales bacterium]|jgi:tRNA(Ile)-lysidine synthase|nr:tRNA lysidine(34) synthetase TilS [Bacteroidales bacterium]
MTKYSKAYLPLFEQFKRFIGFHRLFVPDSTALAAVSGGVDSMVMLHLLHEAGIAVAVAHCNFSLREGESDGDEAFVKQQAAAWGMSFHRIRFNTRKHAAQKGISIEMAARELRYRWFDKLAAQHGYSRIAVAHHRDDNIETLFIRLGRGTGIKGLAGIKPLNGNIVRPLLFASRDEIIAYAKEKKIVFREDSSNTSDDYVRNQLRHHLLPALEKCFPGLRDVLTRDIAHFDEAEAFYRESVERFSRQICRISGDTLYINLKGLLQSPVPHALLYEILQPYGFPVEVSVRALHPPFRSGRLFYSASYRLLCDRKYFLLQPKQPDDDDKQAYPVDLKDPLWHLPHFDLSVNRIERAPDSVPDKSPTTACLDGDLLLPPLLIRKWQPGDRFQPFGMKGTKKLSDFFTDLKLSLAEKEKVQVLTSAGQIVWVIGYRIDGRYGITAATRQTVHISIRRREIK